MSQSAESTTTCQQAQAPASASSSSPFTFKAPYPPSTTPSTPTTGGSQGVSKQRRVSLALPTTPRLVSAWNFRDDTTIDAHVASGEKVPEKKGKMRKAIGSSAPHPFASHDLRPNEMAVMPEKRQRKKWTEEETQMLVNGCNIWGVGNWKAILNDPSLKFDNRSPVDLKDRFRTFFPDAYKLHYPNAKTHLSSKVRSTLPDGSSLFEKTRSKKRRPFTVEEDQALKAGYEKYGTVWSTIVKDPIFQEQKRRSTDLRDRFRNAFPHLYQAAGYKPRSAPKKKRGDASVSAPRMSADDQLLSTRMVAPPRRRRSRTTSGYSFSVPQSTVCSEDEDSSEEEDSFESSRSVMQTVKEMTPQPETQMIAEDAVNEVTMHTIDQLDDLPFADFMPDMSQALSESMTDQALWTLENRSSPQAFDSWSSAATTTTASPTSSHLSMSDYFHESTIGRREGMNMIGKSAWVSSDWLSANPRLETSNASASSSSPQAEGPSPPPASPFSFSQHSHGIMDRYDLFQNTSFAHDFASEVGASDAYSTFSDPDLFPTQSMRGFTHHSNYAGDLIFGARTHQPAQQTNSFSGLGLSGLHQEQQSGAINPMQLHTPGLPGIDELAAINLNDDEPMIPTTAEIGVQKDDEDVNLFGAADLSSLIHLPPQTMEEIVGLSTGTSVDVDVDVSEMDPEANATPPATPAQTGRQSRELHSNASAYSMHSRSMSVPPFERIVAKEAHSHPSQTGHATPQLSSTRSLSMSIFDIPPYDSSSSLQPTASVQPSTSAMFTSPPFMSDSLKSLDLSDLLFLDLHAPTTDPSSNYDPGEDTADQLRTGHALDLAHSPSLSSISGHHNVHAQSSNTVPTYLSSLTGAPSGSGPGLGSSSNMGAGASALGLGTPPSFQMETIGRSAGASLHHRVQSQTAVSPKDLFLSYESRSKRASWDGTAT